MPHGSIEVRLSDKAVGRCSLSPFGVGSSEGDGGDVACEVCPLCGVDVEEGCEEGCDREQRGGERAEKYLQLIHVDMWGAATLPGLGGTKFLLTIVDDFSSYLWVLPLKEKENVDKAFVEWMKKVELNAPGGQVIKRVRVDNGMALALHTNPYCIEKGITREFTVPRSSQRMRTSVALPRDYHAHAHFDSASSLKWFEEKLLRNLLLWCRPRS